jgi:hypothetical protein
MRVSLLPKMALHFKEANILWELRGKQHSLCTSGLSSITGVSKKIQFLFYLPKKKTALLRFRQLVPFCFLFVAWSQSAPSTVKNGSYKKVITDISIDRSLYSTKLKFNIEGCSNTLEEECKAFYHNYGRDGRNYTARAIFPCWYDPGNYDFVVINFYPDKTLMLLIFFAAIPGGILLLSCTYMCGCSRLV